MTKLFNVSFSKRVCKYQEIKSISQYCLQIFFIDNLHIAGIAVVTGKNTIRYAKNLLRRYQPFIVKYYLAKPIFILL